jgi:hypothetical protein
MQSPNLEWYENVQVVTWMMSWPSSVGKLFTDLAQLCSRISRVGHGVSGNFKEAYTSTENFNLVKSVTVTALYRVVDEIALSASAKGTVAGAIQLMQRALTTGSTKRNSVRKLSALLAGNSGTLDIQSVITVMALANYLNQTRIVRRVGQVAKSQQTQTNPLSLASYDKVSFLYRLFTPRTLCGMQPNFP